MCFWRNTSLNGTVLPLDQRYSRFLSSWATRRGALMPLIRNLSETEAAYVAGIIDGEGTITLTRTHRGERRRPVVSVSSTELSLLQYVRSTIGAGRITSKITARDHHSPSYAYVLSSR